jgi:hypothetical protein
MTCKELEANVVALLLSALLAGPVRHFRAAAVLANKKAQLFHSQMRPPAADFPVRMMFYRYASHVGRI